MYYPDFLAEEESDDPENIIIDNIYNSDMAFVNYQFESFIKYNFIKLSIIAFSANILRYLKLNTIF